MEDCNASKRADGSCPTALLLIRFKTGTRLGFLLVVGLCFVVFLDFRGLAATLALQEFLPAQPASPVLQLPLPLQVFLPLQSCFSAFAALSFEASAFLPLSLLSVGLGDCARGRSSQHPTTAAAANIAFFALLMSVSPFIYGAFI